MKKRKSNTIYFVSVATWQNYKNITKRPHLIIESLAEVQNQIEDRLILRMIGGGNMISELKIFADNLNLEVIFFGPRDKNFIVTVLKKSDFFIHASNAETFSIVTVEALKTGTPVLVSNVGAIKELVNDINGILVENSKYAWVEAIKKAINMNFDNEKIAEEYKNKFTYQQVGKLINEVYFQVLKI